MSTAPTFIRPETMLTGSQSSKLRQQVDELLAAGTLPRAILIDFGTVEFMDSCGLGELVQILKTTRAAQVELCLCNLNDQVRMLLELTGMDEVFRIFPNEAAFNSQFLNAASLSHVRAS